MLFNSPEFFLFLGIVLVLYYSLKHRYQNYLLLIVSYIFYSFWDYRFLSLILISTVVDFFAGRAIQRTNKTLNRRLLLMVSLFVNLGILGFFKYFNFFIDNAGRLISVLGFEANLPVLYIILPVGISFYTFQTMAYTIEIYRERMQPVDNFFDFALYVCYFPQLVAGPIERPQNLIPKLQSKRVVTKEIIISGLVLILIGMFRKVVIADGLGAQVDPIFSNPGNYSSPELAKGIYLFALQIYCDFAGYSDIARGVSRLLGIDLMRNFNQPYFSTNVSEFWRRWHISLSTWLRDYLYIPLGGNRRGTLNTYKNLMLTMLLGGLWHGAAWSFGVWGSLHGLYLIVQRVITSNRKGAQIGWNWRRFGGMFITFHLILLTWVFFRSSGLGAALDYISQMLTFRQMDSFFAILPAIIVPWVLVLLIDIPQYISGKHVVLLQWPKAVRNFTIALMVFLIILGVGTRAPFIYFQF